MDPERDEQKQEEQELSSLQKSMKTFSKKTKNIFSMVLKKIIAAIGMPLIIKIVIVLVIIAAITSGLTWLFKFFSDNTIVDVASSSLIKSEATITWSEEEEGYYFKISKDVIYKYLKELNDAYNKRIL